VFSLLEDDFLATCAAFLKALPSLPMINPEDEARRRDSDGEAVGS